MYICGVCVYIYIERERRESANLNANNFELTQSQLSATNIQSVLSVKAQRSVVIN